MNTHAWQEDIDIDIDAGPVASSSRPQANYVPAAPRQPEPLAGLLATPTSGDMDIWRPSGAIHETTTATDRATGLLIRQLPLAAVWLILAIAAALAAWQFASISGAAAALFGLTVFGGCCAATFIAFDRQERDYSGAGLERHRINRAAELKRLELKQAHELKRDALNAYLRHLERDSEP